MPRDTRHADKHTKEKCNNVVNIFENRALHKKTTKWSLFFCGGGTESSLGINACASTVTISVRYTSEIYLLSNSVVLRHCAIKKTTEWSLFFSGGGTETRTLDPMIKSHLLYQLSYASKTELHLTFAGNFDI